MAADEAARKHAVGGDGDAKFAAGAEDVVLDAARDQRVLNLQIANGMDGGGAADGLRADFRKPDVPHVARLDHLGDGADGFLDGHLRIDARRAIDVDVLDAEALQGVGEEIFHGVGPRVVAGPAAHGIAQRAELDAELHLLARHGLERFADEHFVVAHAVKIAGIEQGDAGIQRGVQGGETFGAVGGSVHARHAHATEAEGGDARAVRAEGNNIHQVP